MGRNAEKKTIKNTEYLMFCVKCGVPQQIPDFILKTYFVTEIPGVYCRTCNHQNPIPDYLRKIAGEL